MAVIIQTKETFLNIQTDTHITGDSEKPHTICSIGKERVSTQDRNFTGEGLNIITLLFQFMLSTDNDNNSLR